MNVFLMKNKNNIAWILASVGFMLGIIFLLLLDSIISYLHLNSDKPEGINSKLKKLIMMILDVALG